MLNQEMIFCSIYLWSVFFSNFLHNMNSLVKQTEQTTCATFSEIVSVYKLKLKLKRFSVRLTFVRIIIISSSFSENEVFVNFIIFSCHHCDRLDLIFPCCYTSISLDIIFLIFKITLNNVFFFSLERHFSTTAKENKTFPLFCTNLLNTFFRTAS